MPLRCLLSSYAFVLFFGIIVLFVLPSLVVFILASFFVKYPQDIFQGLASFIYNLFFKIFRPIKLDVTLMEELPSSAIYISTHESNLDYPILGSFLSRYLIMTKLKYKKIPFISLVGDLIGARYVDTNNLDNIAKVYEEFEENLHKDRNLIFFAEGTRNKKKKLKRFKKGAFNLSFRLNKPIVPILLLGTGSLLQKGSFCFSSTQQTRIKVQMLDVIYPQDFENVKEMILHTHMLMQEAKNTLVQEHAEPEIKI